MINDYNAKVLGMIAVFVIVIGWLWYKMEEWIENKKEEKNRRGK